MKPTEKQIKAIDSIVSIIKTWKNTNDITSPTHIVDIYEFLNADLMDIVDENELNQLFESLNRIWVTIRKLEIKR